MVAVLPSAEKVFVDWARVQTDLYALHGGRVGTQLYGTRPAIRVARVSSQIEETWQDIADLQVECWADSQTAADLLARTVLAVLPQLRGLIAAGHVWTYDVVAGPYWAPDDPSVSSLARYILTVQLLTTL